MKTMSLRLDDISQKRLDQIKEFKNNQDGSEFCKLSYNDLIRMAIRCLHEDLGLDG